MPLTKRCSNVFYQGRLPRHITPPPRRLVPSLGLGTTWVRQLRSGSCHHPTAATKCNEQPSQATANPVRGKACSPIKGGLLRLLASQSSVEFLICILLALQMPLIRCSNVFCPGRLSCHIGSEIKTSRFLAKNLTLFQLFASKILMIFSFMYWNMCSRIRIRRLEMTKLKPNIKKAKHNGETLK